MVALGNVGSNEHEWGTKGSKEEAVVLTVEREERQSCGSSRGKGALLRVHGKARPDTRVQRRGQGRRRASEPEGS
jgi:hypothetical protein